MKKVRAQLTIAAIAAALTLIGCASGGDEMSTKDANTPPPTSNDNGMTATSESAIQSEQPANAGDGGGLGK